MNIIFISTIKIVAYLHKYSNNKIKENKKDRKKHKSFTVLLLLRLVQRLKEAVEASKEKLLN